jgi:Flp pilus assembly protein TadB
MEYNWTTSVFIAASDSESGVWLVLVLVLLVVVAVLATIMFPASEQRREERLTEKVKTPKEDGNPIESSQNDANRLLQQIEANTRKTESNTAKTAFWTRVVGVPVLIGLIIGALASMAQCN